MNERNVFFRVVLVVCAAGAMMTMTSCVTESSPGFRSNIPQNQIHFPKLKDYRVTLSPMTSRRSFYAGEDARMVFQLRNVGTKRLIVYEWRLKEAENLRVYYAPYHSGLKELPKSEWKCLKPEAWGDRSTLTLTPKTAALIEVPLPFIKEMDPGELPPKGKRFVMFAELNLESINARSGNFLITVK